MLPTCINAKQSEHLESHAALIRWCDCALIIARDEPLREKEAHIKIAVESSSLSCWLQSVLDLWPSNTMAIHLGQVFTSRLMFISGPYLIFVGPNEYRPYSCFCCQYFWYVDHISGMFTLCLVFWPYFWYVDHISGKFTIFLECWPYI